MKPEQESADFGLGRYDQSPPAMRIAVHIEADEYDKINEALDALGRFVVTPFDYNLVERNFLNLQSVHRFVTIAISLGRRFAEPDHRVLAESIMASIVNWLSAMRLFLDHTETDLKRRFGHESSQVARFKSATKLAFDGHAGYRFSTKFRNYVQHCGLPLSSMQVSPPRRDTGRGAVQSVELMVDRGQLLTNYSEWGPVKRDIEAMPPSFEVTPLVSEAMEGIRSVHRELFGDSTR